MDPGHAKELLAAERQRIEEALGRLTAEFDPESPDGPAEEADTGDQAADLVDRQRDLGRIEELREELEAVERAEARLADGTYGISIESGEPISDVRLERIPTAERTADEQRAFERNPL